MAGCHEFSGQYHAAPGGVENVDGVVFFRRHNKSDLRAATTFALDFTMAADFLQPFAHVHQPVQARARQATGQNRFRQPIGIKAAAIVLRFNTDGYCRGY
jgi:hypothetical protein